MYLMMIVDDFSRLGWPYFLRKKSDAALVFAELLAVIRTDDCPSVVECTCSNDGSEFLSEESVALLNSHGIRRERTPVASPKHDGVVQRRIAACWILGWRLAWKPSTCSTARNCRQQSLYGRRRATTPATSSIGEGEKHAAHALPAPDFLRQSAVCAAAPIPRSRGSTTCGGP